MKHRKRTCVHDCALLRRCRSTTMAVAAHICLLAQYETRIKKKLKKKESRLLASNVSVLEIVAICAAFCFFSFNDYDDDDDNANFLPYFNNNKLLIE